MDQNTPRLGWKGIDMTDETNTSEQDTGIVDTVFNAAEAGADAFMEYTEGVYENNAKLLDILKETSVHVQSGDFAAEIGNIMANLKEEILPVDLDSASPAVPNQTEQSQGMEK